MTWKTFSHQVPLHRLFEVMDKSPITFRKFYMNISLFKICGLPSVSLAGGFN